MLALLLLSFSTVDAEVCPAFTCGELAGDQCISVNVTDFEYIVKPCNGTAVCTPTQTQNSTCAESSNPSQNYPGDYCYLNEDCTSGDCFGFVCRGLGLNAACTHIYDCNPGLQCDLETLTCQQQLGVYEPCVDDYQCQNNLLCEWNSTQQNLACTEYFSIPVGGTVTRMDNAASGLSFGCVSAFAAGTGEEGVYTCKPAPVNLQKLTLPCDAGVPCSDTTKTYSVPCQCGYNEHAEAFCALFPGDPPAQTALKSLQAFLQTNSMCNTFSRFSFNCFATNGLADISAFYQFAANYSLLMGNTYTATMNSAECLQQVYSSDYYNLNAAMHQYETSKCTRFASGEGLDLPPDQCWMLDRMTTDYLITETVYTQSCQNGTVCSGTEAANVTCAEVPTRYPGDACSANSDCVFGNCTNKVCTGLTLGETCLDVYFCEAALFCNMTSQKCEMQVAGSGACDSPLDCMNAFTCSLGQCVKYFSLPVGTETDVFEADGFSEACSTGYVQLAVPGSNAGVCSTPPVSNSTQVLRICNPGELCWSANKTSYKMCECGLSPESLSYCPYFEGDSPLQTAITNYNAAMANFTGGSCNTYSRNTYACFLGAYNMDPFFYFALNLTQYKVAHLVLDAVPSAAATFAQTQDYYILQQQYQNYTPPPTPGPEPKNSAVTLGLCAIAVSLVL